MEFVRNLGDFLPKLYRVVGMRFELLLPLRRNIAESRRVAWPSLRWCVNLGILLTAGFSLSSCGSSPDRYSSGSHINNKTKFSSKAYGVAASPRVTTSRKIRRGGGRAQIGKPYKIRGKWYRPREQPGYNKIGRASWYGPNFHGRLTANGEIYDQYALSAAHPTFPLPSYARVTNLANGNSVVVRVNDRGPYASGRIIDMSSRAADLLDYKRDGTARVRVQYLGKARLDGRDQRFLAASYKPGKGYRRGIPGILPGATPNAVPNVLIAARRPKTGVGNTPVLSFVKAPLPKERPLFTGGIPLNIQAFARPLPNPSNIQRSFTSTSAWQQTKPANKLEPLGRERLRRIKNSFVRSSYVVGQRISIAHEAAQAAINILDKSNVTGQWKYTSSAAIIHPINSEPNSEK